MHVVTVNAVIFRGDKFLLLKRSSKEIAFPGKWAFPGGKVEKGESLSVALKREIKEETGLDFKDPILVRDYEFTRPDGLHVIGFHYCVDAATGEVSVPEEFEGHKWVTLQELMTLDRIASLEDTVKKAMEVR